MKQSRKHCARADLRNGPSFAQARLKPAALLVSCTQERKKNRSQGRGGKVQKLESVERAAKESPQAGLEPAAIRLKA